MRCTRVLFFHFQLQGSNIIENKAHIHIHIGQLCIHFWQKFWTLCTIHASWWCIDVACCMIRFNYQAIMMLWLKARICCFMPSFLCGWYRGLEIGSGGREGTSSMKDGWPCEGPHARGGHWCFGGWAIGSCNPTWWWLFWFIVLLGQYVHSFSTNWWTKLVLFS